MQLEHAQGLRGCGQEEEFHSRGAHARVCSTAARFIVLLRLTSLSGFCLYSRACASRCCKSPSGRAALHLFGRKVRLLHCLPVGWPSTLAFAEGVNMHASTFQPHNTLGSIWTGGRSLPWPFSLNWRQQMGFSTDKIAQIKLRRVACVAFKTQSRAIRSVCLSDSKPCMLCRTRDSRGR